MSIDAAPPKWVELIVIVLVAALLGLGNAGLAWLIQYQAAHTWWF